jgi:carbonic anhydrase
MRSSAVSDQMGEECWMCDACLLSRRRLLAAGAVLGIGGWVRAARAEAAPNAIKPDEALKRLMDGNARYAANRTGLRDFSAERAARAKAQFPIAAVLSCSDSRVAPELAFDQGQGGIFVVRLAGNFVNDDGLASLEYAVRFLGVPLIVVLGHSKCGAVEAAIKVMTEKAELPGHLPELVASIRPAVEAAQRSNPSDLLAAAIKENVKRSVSRLEGEPAILAPAVSAKSIRVVGGIYELATGKIELV